ncbi:hypothetical protein, conserved [Plasmodium gonderi]|uniref:Uncharacterized protein n=1 Tax=Plasmodium gonderi TaxID=77519 RepID=A0A1Y1JCM0_PLAGO|nr:hypothetical protein, conserved [Plasmodium gonderi]GAW79105.1 hypothetical protein, conserved [Plasmodium gonderi]
MNRRIRPALGISTILSCCSYHQIALPRSRYLILKKYLTQIVGKEKKGHHRRSDVDRNVTEEYSYPLACRGKIEKKKRKNIYQTSIFYDEVTDKINVENNKNILNIIRNSKIKNFSVNDCILFMNYIIRNKKNSQLDKETKNLNKVKLTSTLYKEANEKIIKSILTYEPKYIFFFFNKFSELRDINTLKYLFIHMYTNHILQLFSIYHLTEIIYNLSMLNCTLGNNEQILNTFLDYFLTNVIQKNQNIKKLQKKVINHSNTNADATSEPKAVYIRSLTGRTTKTEYRQHVQEFRQKWPLNRDPIKEEDAQFSVKSLSNVMLYKLIYGLTKMNQRKEQVKEMLVLLIPYIRFQIQNKNYIFSRERSDIIVKIVWSYAYLQERHINLFIDFSLCIQMVIDELKLEHLKIVKKIYENLLIFDESLLDKLDERINHIENNSPQQFSQPRKKPFKKKKKRLEMTDEIRFKFKGSHA